MILELASTPNQSGVLEEIIKTINQLNAKTQTFPLSFAPGRSSRKGEYWQEGENQFTRAEGVIASGSAEFAVAPLLA